MPTSSHPPGPVPPPSEHKSTLSLCALAYLGKLLEGNHTVVAIFFKNIYICLSMYLACGIFSCGLWNLVP